MAVWCKKTGKAQYTQLQQSCCRVQIWSTSQSNSSSSAVDDSVVSLQLAHSVKASNEPYTGSDDTTAGQDTLCKHAKYCNERWDSLSRSKQNIAEIMVTYQYHQWMNKKLSYRRETARQLPKWRGLGPPAHYPSAPLATPMRMVEFESHNAPTSSVRPLSAL